MLRLILGRAGTGKTGLIINEIKAAVDTRQGGRILIVPEQYSHEAERELCRVCGDSVSRFAEVFSFTGFARRIASIQGGGSAAYLDSGGRLLCMALALGGISTRLKVYGAAARRAELQPMLLSAVDELKSACITPELLLAAAECGGGLGAKLEDMALIMEAYDAAAANGHADPTDRLTVLAEQIPHSDMGAHTVVYVDGFIDFTRQETEVLFALLRKGVELCLCLTVDDLNGDSEIYALSRRSARLLTAYAVELGAEVRTETCAESGGKAPALAYLADRLFTWTEESYAGDRVPVTLFRAGSVNDECELAAARAIALVRDGGCRWRDIAVALRGFDSYRAALESAFEHYGVPLFTARRSDMLSKPLPAMISLVYAILSGGWDVDDVVSYIRTGLAGLDSDQCDILENYIFKWQLRAGAWLGDADWHQHPDGYGNEYDETANARLAEINALRRRVSAPLLRFQRQAEAAETAAQQAAALADFFAAVELPERLAARSEELTAAGRETTAAEYSQLWELTVSALEQSAAILGDSPMSMDEFGRLFTIMLSKYDVGTIPVSLDRVSAGDFDRMRRRSIKHLIVLGMSDERVPAGSEETGIFSGDERRRLLEMDIDLGGGDSGLWREFSLIYSCLSLPGESLTLSYPAVNAEGTAQRPAFVMKRAAELFGLDILPVDTGENRMNAPAPAMTLAAHALRGAGDGREKAAEEYFRASVPERFAALCAAAKADRGRLSPAAVEKLYGKDMRLSASRADRLAACKFAYFCQYGLKARPYEPAGFTPPEIGTFMHFVLENTAREVRALGGFKAVEDAAVTEIADRAVAEYVKTELNDFREKSARFRYLFKRLTGDVRQIVADMAAELRRSDFEPLSFELDFSRAAEIPPIELGGGEGSLTLTGIADRVDGWLHNGKLYLRVVDYKTGKKKFSLSDIWYGMGLQMLMYLFALEENGEKLYGEKIVPAGVMYVPARNAMLSVSRDLSDEDAEEKRLEEQRRSGLVLDDAEVIEAWENGDDKRYIPIRFTGRNASETAADAAHLGMLSQHIRRSLTDMAAELRRGEITADPYFRTQQENACVNCDYFGVCHFENGQNGESCRFMPKLSADRVWTLMEGGRENG